MTQAVSILLCALGGEGGGVLADWLVDVARIADYPAQATSIPGVAQRTGATTYYLEIYPVSNSQLKGQKPVLGLNPLPGRLDALVSSELLETARQIGNGFASADRTCVISSSSRALTTAEKMVMGDGRRSEAPLLDVISANSLRHHVLDMGTLCREAGTMVSAVMLGAIANSASAKASLRGFTLAFERVSLQREQAQYVEKVLSPAAPKTSLVFSLPTQVAQQFPNHTHELLALAFDRLVQYQNENYAQLMVTRLLKLKAIELASPGASADCPVTTEAIRWLALWMAFDDIIQVAHLKSKATRWQRVSTEVKLKEGELLKVYDHFKPGVPEIAAMLPSSWAQGLLRWDRARILKGKAAWSMPIKLARHSVVGLLSLRFLAAMRALRPLGSRYATEQALIEEWLEGIGQACLRSSELALEVARCGQLIKGYGSTNERGKDNLLHILRTVCQPAADKSVDVQASVVAQIRKAALQDEKGQSFDLALLQHGAPARPVKEQPILWMKNPRVKQTS
jgi:indolepyruvate ferredoxin oxidoreductase beta subunit